MGFAGSGGMVAGGVVVGRRRQRGFREMTVRGEGEGGS